jgi:hypothetical protein
LQIFQPTVLKNFKQDENLVKSRWISYQKFFEKIDFVKKVKEEKYQDGFLKDIFENCLGYTLETTNPQNYNIRREEKNETDSKKADGVILVDGKVVGIIELKDQKTKNLDQIEEQAFNYHNSHTNSRYIIISNFNELRFYIDKKTKFESFRLFSLNFEEFKKLHAILSFESISENAPLNFLEETTKFEKDISEQFYEEFSKIRVELFEEIVNDFEIVDNSTKLMALNLAQKILDRLVFLFFAESRGLLQFSKKYILESWKSDIYENPLWETLKIIFQKVDVGGKIPKTFAYNGGLFAFDEKLNNLKISDEVLQKAVNLGSYDFSADLDVNILGHIFENSLSDLEELQANINKIEFKKEKSKRKKDGVFYTPPFITKYIVENTIGKTCQENWKRIVKNESEKEILEYKNFLENLKILDPAVGSGAFLNEALDFLVKEHEKVREKLENFGDLTLETEIDKEILENNLFGVDINESAIEIAKLSLWIKTAKPNRKLSNLNNNFICANSLLEMPFPENSFDIVLGNPPYVRIQGLKSNYEDESKLYEEKFVSATGNYDLYVIFLEMSFKMLNQNGKLGFILPHKFLISDFGVGIRGFLAKNRAVESLLHFGSEMVFDDASTYTCIVTLSHNNEKLKFKSISPKDIFNPIIFDEINYEKLGSDKWNLSNQNVAKVLAKINLQPLKVKDVFAKIFQGIATSGDDVYLLLQTKKGLYSKSLDRIVEVEKGLLKPILKGEDIGKYKHLQNRYFVIFPYLIENTKAQAMSEEYIKENFPKGYKYLQANEEFLRGREKGKMVKDGWFLFGRKQGIDEVEQPKIITSYMGNFSNMSFDEGILYHNTKCYSFIKKDEIKEDYKFYLSILNSSLFWFFIKNTSAEFRGGYFTFNTNYINPFPLPKLENLEEQTPFIEKADLMLELNSKLQNVKKSFLDEVQLEKVPKKVQNFENLEFDEFVREFAKAKKIKFADKLAERNFKNEWKSIFENDKKDVLKLQNQINLTEKEIDQMVYKLYDLSEDEIKIVKLS